MARPRKIIYTPEQEDAMEAVYEAGIRLYEARIDVANATRHAQQAVRDALLLGIHYKELRGLSQSFKYRVLKSLEEEAA